jgi:hypothetical protein
MKNIHEIMREFGVEIPKEEQKNFEKALFANYKTSADYNKQKEKLEKANHIIAENEKVLKDLNERLEKVGDTNVSDLEKRIYNLEKAKHAVELEYREPISKSGVDIKLCVMSGVNNKTEVGVR